ncbi:MAG: lipid-A-disaccharide synthase [Hyphomicrobium sp.]
MNGLSQSEPGRIRAPKLFIVAGEHSGDALGEKLMAALTQLTGGHALFSGVGGAGMERQGLTSLFPLHEVAVMGPLSILVHLPRLVRRVHDTVAAAIAAGPDAVIIIDAPEFTHPIAKRIRKRRPDIPIIDYVSPSVWAWRPGRATKMRSYIDHVLALLPFEPAAHERLGGPACTYVGHPLIERLEAMRAIDTKPLSAKLGLDPARPVLVVLPGSRASEIGRLIGPFGEVLAQLRASGLKPEVIVPVVASARARVVKGLEKWPVKPHLVEGEDEKFASFRLATAALAASGTVTLELALCRVPSVVGYRVDPIAAPVLRRALKLPSVVLPNLIAGHNIYPEFHQEACTAKNLAAALAPLFSQTPERAAQLAGLDAIPRRMQPPDRSPSLAAAAIVLRLAAQGRG